jgi:hypothetical protein
MKRLVAGLVVLGLLAGGLFVAAAAHEVLSLGKRLTGRIGRLEGPLASPRPSAPSAPASGGQAGGEAHADGRPFTSVRVTLTAEDLGALLGQTGESLGGALQRERAVQVRLGEGRVVIDSRNRLATLGLPVADYGGHSAWALTALPDGVGIALVELRVAGVPVPGAEALLRQLSPRRRDDWVVVPTGSHHVVERIEILPGRLTVTGRVR